MNRALSMHSRAPRALAFGLLVVSGTAHAATPDILAAPALGDDLGGEPVALDLAGDATIVLSRDADGLGRLLRLDASGAAAGPAVRVDQRATDLAVDRTTGNVVVVGDTELAVFDPGFTRLWQRALPADDRAGARRVAVGERGTIAMLARDELHTFTPAGLALGRATADEGARDVAVLDASGVVVVTGWQTRELCDQSLDVTTLAGFGLDGAPRWRAYDDASVTARCGRGEDVASARGVAVSRGEDGQIYLLAEVEGANNQFLGHAGRPATNVAFDTYTAPDALPALYAYYARFTADGEHVLGQFFALPDTGSVVRPRAIGADVHGNVVFTGSASHSLGAAGEQVHTERLDAAAGFYQVVEPDFEARREWQQLEGDRATELSALAVAEDRAVTLMHVAAGPDGDGLPTGPSVLMWPGHHGPVAAEKRPDPETQGTFGYESGVSGSDPDCHCDARQVPTPGLLLTFGLFVLAGLTRPGRRA